MTISYPNNALKMSEGLFILNMAQVLRYLRNIVCVKKHQLLKQVFFGGGGK